MPQFVAVYSDAGGTWEYNYRSAERENRMILGMLRGKNAPFVKFWFTPAEDEPSPEVNDRAFRDTHALVQRVWSTTVRSVEGVVGAIPPYDPDADEKLEYTLRDEEGEDQMVSFFANEDPVLAMQVVVEVPHPFNTVFDYEVNLEALAPPGVTGELYVWNTNTSQFVLVNTMEGTADYTSYAAAEWDQDGDTLQSIRRTFWLNNNGNYIKQPTTQHPYTHLTFRVYHYHAGAELESRFDLFQIIPVQKIFNPLAEPEKALAIADLNADLVVDLNDLNLFVSGYLNENSIADIDQDSDWDQDDIDAFLAAYTGQ